MATATKGLSVENFRNKLLQEVQETCTAQGLKFDVEQGRGFAFQKWVSSLLCAHEGVEEDKVTTFSTNDLKFDVIIEDDDQKVIYFCQTKFASVKSNPDLSESEVHDFFQRHQLLSMVIGYTNMRVMSCSTMWVIMRHPSTTGGRRISIS
jgi:hypothetical protein